MSDQRKKRIISLFPTCRRMFVNHDIKKQLLSRSYGTVLVIGAGRDPYRPFVKADRYVSTDVVSTKVTDVVCDAHCIPFRDASFDLVYASEVLEHLQNPAIFAGEAFRVLRKEIGHLILTIPYLFHEHGAVQDYYRMSPHALTKLLGDFQSVEITPQGNRLNTLSDLVTTSNKWVVPLRIINYLLVPLSCLSHGISTAPTGFLVVARK